VRNEGNQMHKHLRGGVGAVAALAIFAISSPVTVHAEPARVVASATSSATTAAVRNANGSFTVSWSGAGRHQVYASTRPGNPSKNGRLVGASAFGTLNVKGLEDDARWYFEVERAERSEEHTSELQSRENLVCRLLLEKKKKNKSA